MWWRFPRSASVSPRLRTGVRRLARAGRAKENDCAVLIRKPDSQHLRHKLADLPGRKIDDCRHLPSDQLLGSVVDCNLGARPLCPERRPEIDRKLAGWVARFRERLCLTMVPMRMSTARNRSKEIVGAA